MPESIVSTGLGQTPEGNNLCCHLCGRTNNQHISLGSVPPDIAALLKANADVAGELGQVCVNCVELFNRAKAQIDSHQVVFELTDHVLPTPLRMDADERFTGRGVTIAFLDSGFYAHDDLTKPENRIVAYRNIFDGEDDRTSLETTDVASWHGMMTSVVAAGNGYLSDGFYRGIAPAVKVVLVKVGRTGHIPDEHIVRGLEWVLDNRKKYDIRIVNISAGGDFEQSYLDSSLCRIVERAVGEGLIVVCAVGNAGMAPRHPVLPPAASPSAIAACMLEANPTLTPQQVKRILIDTAERVPGIAVERQGWGVVAPRKAVEVALLANGRR